MINRLSASASEIFAGAIQDYQRGIIIGDQTFGKGTVQQLMPLQYGALKLTQSKFYRISGDSTQHRGVLPDIAFPSLYDPKEVGESALDKAMPWDRIAPVPHKIYFDIQDGLPTLTAKHQERAKNDPDFIFLRAQLAAAEEARKHTRLSLNEAVRKREMAEEKAKALDLENKRRSAKGEKPLAKLDEPEEEDGDLPPKDKNKEKDKPDPIVTEAGRILLDAMPIYQRPSYAQSYDRRY
jgi:carboxyl-terminal processing protease